MCLSRNISLYFPKTLNPAFVLIGTSCFVQFSIAVVCPRYLWLDIFSILVPSICMLSVLSIFVINLFLIVVFFPPLYVVIITRKARGRLLLYSSFEKHFLGKMSLSPRLIEPPSRWAPVSLGPVSLCPRLVGPPCHWALASLDPRVFEPPSFWVPVSLGPQVYIYDLSGSSI